MGFKIDLKTILTPFYVHNFIFKFKSENQKLKKLTTTLTFQIRIFL